MSDLDFTLTDEERQLLVAMLESRLGDSRVESRHTRTEDYREKVQEEVSLIESLLGKLRR